MDDYVAVFDLHDPKQKQSVLEWYSQFGTPCPCPDIVKVDMARYFVKTGVSGCGERDFADNLYEVQKMIDRAVAWSEEESPEGDFTYSATDEIFEALEALSENTYQ